MILKTFAVSQKRSNLLCRKVFEAKAILIFEKVKFKEHVLF